MADPGDSDAVTWIGLLRTRGAERDRYLNALTLTGDPKWITEFRQLLTAKG